MSSTLELLKRLRGMKLSQSEISRRTGIAQPKLSRWEAGEVPDSADHALKLLKLVTELEGKAAEAPEPSEAPASAPDAYAPAQEETVKRLEAATKPLLKRRRTDREGPGAGDERHRYSHPDSVNRERHPK
jgi:transcriptional regulator with XRE-family HTH domain